MSFAARDCFVDHQKSCLIEKDGSHKSNSSHKMKQQEDCWLNNGMKYNVV